MTRPVRDFEMSSVTTDGMGRLLGDGSESGSSSDRQNNKRKRQDQSDDESRYDDAQTSNDDARTSNDDTRAAGETDHNSNGDELLDDDLTANRRINLSALAKYSKLDIRRLLDEETNRISFVKPAGGGAHWSAFKELHIDGRYSNYVQCLSCESVLKYTKAGGISSIKTHASSCKTKSDTESTLSANSVERQVFRDLPPRAIKRLTRATSLCAAVDVRSFNSFHGDGFREYVQTVIDLTAVHGRFKYKPPAVSTISFNVVQLHEQVKAGMIELFRNVRTVSCSLDHWTCSVSGDKYLGILATYLDRKEQRLKTRVIYMNEVDNKKSETTRSMFDFATKEYEIELKVKSVTTDNAADVKGAFANDDDLDWLGCAAHQMNTALRATDTEMQADETNHKDILKQTKACKSLVEYVKRSGKQNLMFKTLKQDVLVRFDSKLDLFGSVKINKDVYPNTEDAEIIKLAEPICFELVDKLVEVFRLVHSSRLSISGEDQPTVNLVLPVKIELIRKLSEESSDSRIENYKRILIEKIQQKVIVNEHHRLATYLTPAFRNKKAIFSAEEKADLQAKLRSVIADSVDENQNRLPPELPDTERPTQKHSFLSDLMNEEEGEEDENDEISLYERMKVKPAHRDNVLGFWIENLNLFPKLGELALDLLSRPATSTAVERLFSISGLAVTDRRNRLKPTSLQACLAVRSNKDLLEDSP